MSYIIFNQSRIRRKRSLWFFITLWFFIGISQVSGQRPAASYYKSGMAFYEKFEEIEPLFHLDSDTTYIINFWATWCKPCVEELPYFEEFTEKHIKSKYKVILVSLDFPKQIDSRLVPYVKENKLQSEVVVLLDGKFNNWIDKVSPEWDGAIPVSYIYKRDKVTFVPEAVESLQELENIVDSI